ncbi:hypothetical protein DFH09DRAFT_1104319 [Mycena vulgaris]|nr:hypothetical protein DFH09DRAFT_1104319 [Mycena vulgaris]
MWIRFETASEGLRALGAISRIGRTEDASFSSDGEFHEAATYSHDLWSLETKDVEMRPPSPKREPPTTPLTPTIVPSLPSPPLVLLPASAVSPTSDAHPTRMHTPHVLSTPRAPRAMLKDTESLSKLSLEDRLSDAPSVPLTSLAQRLSCSTPPLASQISDAEKEPPSKRQKLAAMTSPAPPVTPWPSPSTSPSKRKWRGTRVRRLVKEQQAMREKRKAEAEALAAQAEATGDSTLLEWIPTLVVVAEEETAVPVALRIEHPYLMYLTYSTPPPRVSGVTTTHRDHPYSLQGAEPAIPAPLSRWWRWEGMREEVGPGLEVYVTQQAALHQEIARKFKVAWDILAATDGLLGESMATFAQIMGGNVEATRTQGKAGGTSGFQWHLTGEGRRYNFGVSIKGQLTLPAPTPGPTLPGLVPNNEDDLAIFDINDIMRDEDLIEAIMRADQAEVEKRELCATVSSLQAHVAMMQSNFQDHKRIQPLASSWRRDSSNMSPTTIVTPNTDKFLEFYGLLELSPTVSLIMRYVTAVEWKAEVARLPEISSMLADGLTWQRGEQTQGRRKNPMEGGWTQAGGKIRRKGGWAQGRQKNPMEKRVDTRWMENLMERRAGARWAESVTTRNDLRMARVSLPSRVPSTPSYHPPPGYAFASPAPLGGRTQGGWKIQQTRGWAEILDGKENRTLDTSGSVHLSPPSLFPAMVKTIAAVSAPRNHQSPVKHCAPLTAEEKKEKHKATKETQEKIDEEVATQAKAIELGL